MGVTECVSVDALLADRDLGSCLTNVHVLWMARCATSDLDGVASLSNLRELYLAYNDIVDISPCSLLELIQILDLEGFVCCTRSDTLSLIIVGLANSYGVAARSFLVSMPSVWNKLLDCLRDLTLF